MKQLVKLISEKNYTEADRELADIIPNLLEQKLLEMKKAVAAKMYEQMGAIGPSRAEKLRSGVLEAIDPKEDSLSVERGTPQPKKNETIVPKLEPGSTHYKNVQESDDMGPAKQKKEKIYIHTHKTSGKEKHMSTSKPTSNEWEVKELKEEEQLDEARINIVKARVRGGVIQRRKKVSNVPGMTLRGGTLKRMSAAERRRRKMGARKGKMKRKAKMTRILMKRKRSLQKRKSLGL